jgi:hypothetical protein
MKRPSELSSNSSISDEEREAICRLYKSGLSVSDISLQKSIANHIIYYTLREWGPNNSFPYLKREQTRSVPSHRQKIRAKLVGFENTHSVVIAPDRPGYFRVRCKNCGGEHTQSARGIKAGSMIRICPKFKPYNHSGASNRQDNILQKQYGISLEDYESMLLRQDYKCRICEIPEDRFVGSFHVDHSHISGKVRGLLCPSCNHAIGMFDDDISKLRRARQYMSNYGDVKLSPLERRSQLFVERYGLSEAAYRSLYNRQLGKCQICGEKPMVKHPRLTADPNKNYEKMICKNCFGGVYTNFDGDTSVLRRASQYLRNG